MPAHARVGRARRSAGRSRSMLICITVAVSTVGLGAVAVAAEPQSAGPALVPGTPCTVSAKACVDLAEHHAWLIRDGAVLRGPVDLSDGADGEDATPAGTFRVEWKAEQYTSREYGTPMPYSVFFAPGGIAFHQGDLGTSSAGCVRLSQQDAKAFFEYLQVGDEVQVA